MLKQKEGKFAADNENTLVEKQVQKNDNNNPFWRSNSITFEIERKGYCKEEVDFYIKELSQEYQRMYERYQEFEHCENIIAKSIMSAEKAAQLIITQAKEEAKNILLKAYDEADSSKSVGKNLPKTNNAASLNQKLKYGKDDDDERNISSRTQSPVKQTYENVNADRSTRPADVDSFLKGLTSDVTPANKNANENSANYSFDSILAEIRGEHGKTTE